MDIHELILKSLGRAYAAKLAMQAGHPDIALTEIVKLREMLNDQPMLEAGGTTEPPPPERSKS